MRFMEKPEPVRRSSDIEELTNLYFIHPIANRLTILLARMRVPPNAVSVAGMAFGVMAGYAYYHYPDRWSVIAGFCLMIGWHVMDGADGQLARLTRSQSEVGKVLDGVCDYVTFIAVYAALAAVLSREHGQWVWYVVVIAGVCHAIQAAVYEMQRQDYNFWGWAQKSSELLNLATRRPRDVAPASVIQRIADRLHRSYVSVQFLAIGVNAGSIRRLSAVLDSQPERDASIRRWYRRIFAPALRRWSIMSANYRTLGIFLFAILKRPVFYFYLEIFGFSAILVALLIFQKRRYAVFFTGLDAAG